jgi:enterochelin esterase family protein
VLYLLHGWSDTAGGWSSIGQANYILDNLIAAGKAKPMIVVMPLGYGEMSFVYDGWGEWNKFADIDRNTNLFQESLLTEVMPRVNAEYNVATGRENTAIAGLSMGGLEALSVGLKHTGMFAYVGGFSAAVHMLQPTNLSGLNPKTADLKELWISCGTEDGLIAANRKLSAYLKGEGLAVQEVETPGMHTWMVWRDNLVNFLPLLFAGK